MFDSLVADRPMIRYSARSRIGSQIDLHLRRLELRIPRRVEIDSSDTLVSMVASGVGWAISTPLCLLQARAYLDQVRVSRLPAPGFRRKIVLLSREGECEGLPERIASASCAILSSSIKRDIAAVSGWLADELLVGEAQP
jgi:DNA-binding transcriptional LysR family regulator